MNPKSTTRQRKKTIVMVCIMVPVALLHFVTGRSYTGPWPEFVNGYLIDLLLPFAVYFLLCPQDAVVPFLRPWYVKAIPVLAIGFTVETAQFFGVPLLGQTFDPLDYCMYTLGVALAVLFDTMAFPRLFPFWRHDPT